jgi:hypothetical protein
MTETYTFTLLATCPPKTKALARLENFHGVVEEYLDLDNEFSNEHALNLLGLVNEIVRLTEGADLIAFSQEVGHG